jgi:hypothetical protein
MRAFIPLKNLTIAILPGIEVLVELGSGVRIGLHKEPEAER